MIKEYDLGLLRRKVWVAVNTTREELNSLLSFQTDHETYEELSDYRFKDFLTSNAVTGRVRDKKEGYFGYLVLLCKNFDKGSDLVDCIAHEACHVSDYVQGYLGCSTTDPEMNGHITGYVAGKIMLTYNEEKYGTEEINTQPVAE